ncbi:toll/interleukin-1 receptor domain-containing protein [Paracoccus methylovorus]|uniref:Toll/interleukin-1 receptor domain-containing protein n=1 Tax=Paracoccus methylovorus TaxID=2812658 RepID=A0ABX7JPG5_9RHOB|nr:toll/interleukin-1 receptor domain-containing protein [Paracoccus methylovorus]QRZ15739.1 toll/interleukin-1 receptor domain-containing protein [Paracoccus methylovorus]
MSYVFLSHSHPDKPFARKLAADLRANGHSVWIDEAETNIGDSLIEKIRNGLDQVDYVCALLSQASIQSPWVQRELDIASNREIDERRVVVLPLLLEDVDLPGFLRGKLYGNFRDSDSYDISVTALLRALGPVVVPPQPSSEELRALKEELASAQAASPLIRLQRLELRLRPYVQSLINCENPFTLQMQNFLLMRQSTILMRLRPQVVL